MSTNNQRGKQYFLDACPFIVACKKWDGAKAKSAFCRRHACVEGMNQKNHRTRTDEGKWIPYAEGNKSGVL